MGDKDWERGGEAMKVRRIDYEVAEVLATHREDSEIYEGIGVGKRKIEDAETIPILDDMGQEINIRPADMWQYEADSQRGAIDWETFQQTYGADELGRRK